MNCASPRAVSSNASIVVGGFRDPKLTARLDDMLEEAEVGDRAFTADQARIARQAYRDYGKGSGHLPT